LRQVPGATPTSFLNARRWRGRRTRRAGQFPFEPKVHVNYQKTVLRAKDGLPKFKDVPAEMGGSGATLPE